MKANILVQTAKMFMDFYFYSKLRFKDGLVKWENFLGFKIII